MGLVGNEVGALYLIDGLNLGESCQVFVIKDLILHFSLGKREMDRNRGRKIRGKGERRQNPGTEGTSFSFLLKTKLEDGRLTAG